MQVLFPNHSPFYDSPESVCTPMFLLLFVSLLFSQTVFHFSLCYEYGSLFYSDRIRRREERPYYLTVSGSMVRSVRKNIGKNDAKQGIE